jgi:hypothetical protein
MWKLIKLIIIVCIILFALSLFRCDENGGISGVISDVIVGTEKLWDSTKAQVEEKREERK